jgi:hypothetical protein
MVCFKQQAHEAVVSLFYLETMGTTEPFLVPGGFHSTPMGGTSAAVIGCTGRCQGACRGQGVAHCGECALDFLDGLGEGSVGGNQVADGRVFLERCVVKVVKGAHHLLGLFELRGLIGTKGGFAGSHARDVTHFCECCHPM